MAEDSITQDGSDDPIPELSSHFNYIALISAIFQFLENDEAFNCQEDGLIGEFTCYSIPNEVPAYLYVEDSYWCAGEFDSQEMELQTTVQGPKYYCLLYWQHPQLQSVLKNYQPEDYAAYDFLPDLLWELGFEEMSAIEWYPIADSYSLIKADLDKPTIFLPES